MQSFLTRPRPLCGALFLLTFAACFAMPAASRGASSAQIDSAINKAKEYIYSRQRDGGTWEEQNTPPKNPAADQRGVSGGQWTGTTALMTYALLAAGESPTDPKLEKAITFLTKTETQGVYALGIRMQVWLLLPRKPEYLAAAKRDSAVLMKSIKTTGNAAGMYDYIPTGGSYSHSRSQYGVLGVWAAEQLGIEVPLTYWTLVEKNWIDHQDKDGGWNYKSAKEAGYDNTPGMTAVGIATLFITQDYTRAAEGLACKGNISNPSVEKGLKWMTDHMQMVASDARFDRSYPYVSLYAVERIGVAGGIKYFGSVDWYQKGANWLISNQRRAGNWSGIGGGWSNDVDTAFATLFLARGRAPIAFNKLDYANGQSGPTAPAWNQRPRDLANATRWISGQVETHLGWQVVPASAPLSDLLDAPILYLSGTKALDLDAATKEKLKAYVQAGGMIVGNADCGGSAFTLSFKKLMSEVFAPYEMRELPETHPLYTTNFPRSKWRVKPSIQGLSNGVRELAILVPSADPAKIWQSRVVGGKEEAWQLAGAIFLYATESKNLRYRGENHLVQADTSVAATQSLAVSRLQHSNTNWDPEPGGWRRLANVVHNQIKLDLKVSTVKLGGGEIPAGGLAHMTGTAKFNLSPDQRAELKKYVEAGGTLLIDAAGGSSAFADAAEAELHAIFPGSKLDFIPDEHPLFSPNGKKIEAVKYRRLVQKQLAGQLKGPRLRGIEIGGRMAVLFSREDLSGGLVGQSVEGILGYEPASATELVSAIAVYAAKK